MYLKKVIKMKKLTAVALALIPSLALAFQSPTAMATPIQEINGAEEITKIASTRRRYYFTIYNVDKGATISVMYFGKTYQLKPNSSKRFYVDTTNKYGNVNLRFDKIAGNNRYDSMNLSLNSKFNNLEVWRTNSHYLTWKYVNKPTSPRYNSYKWKITNVDKHNTISYYMYGKKYILGPNRYRVHTKVNGRESTVHLIFDRVAGDGKQTNLYYDFPAKEYDLQVYRSNNGLIQHQLKKR